MCGTKSNSVAIVYQVFVSVHLKGELLEVLTSCEHLSGCSTQIRRRGGSATSELLDKHPVLDEQKQSKTIKNISKPYPFEVLHSICECWRRVIVRCLEMASCKLLSWIISYDQWISSDLRMDVSRSTNGQRKS